MRDDLLHAEASVDWAETNIPLFKKRLDTWLSKNMHLAVREQPPDIPNNVVVIAEKEPFPLSFHVEAGIYINAIRSSLDMLASALAERHCKPLVDDAYYPVAASEDVLLSGKGFKGDKFIQALPVKERRIIELQRPHRGSDGNRILCILHDLDIVRKHARLLSVEISPRSFVVSGWGEMKKIFTPISRGWLRTGPDETTIGLLAKDAPQQPKIKFTPQVSFSETAYLPHADVVIALYDFAKMAKTIIREFDYS